MKSTARNARVLRAAPILVLAFLLTGGGAAPAAKVVTRDPNAAQVLAAETAAPGRSTIERNGGLALPALAPSAPSAPSSERRIAEFTADAIAKAAAEELQAERAKARAEARAEAKARARAEAKAQARAESRNHSPVYRGTNHFWMPSLGMSYGVHTYACSRSSALANVIYRWGCAGDNNVYIMGHAWGVMDNLHDAYVRGTLRRGMVAVYANGNGKVTRYAITEWRVVDPSNSGWAIASQSRPSMTLQTCVGKNGSKRLVVRLVAVS